MKVFRLKILLGGNNGFRRPGNVISVDPGIAFFKNNMALTLNVPFAIRRERPQSVTDKKTEALTGNPRNGDAAFADYLINFGVSYRFTRNKLKLDPALLQEFKN